MTMPFSMRNEPLVVMHSALAPAEVLAALHRSIDEERKTLFSLSGYKGFQPVLGKIADTSFRVQKRKYWRNDFAPHFYGQLHAERSGTRIEGYFDVARWVTSFMRFWIGGVLLMGSPIFILSLLDITTGSRHISGDAWVGVVVPPAMVAFGFLLPKFGKLMALGEQRFLLEYLQQNLAARIQREIPEPNLPR